LILNFQSHSKNQEDKKTTKSESPEEKDVADEKAWINASSYVASLGPVFASRVAKLCGRDWYRLRRLLEVAYTIVQTKTQSSTGAVENKGIDETLILQNLSDAEIYTGIRSGSLHDAGFDVRCFFLCPNERMHHFHTVDQRCEDMLLRGLLRETTELYASGGIPEDSQLKRAIGYRQALDYLLRKDAKVNDHDAFLSFVDDFATATRQYAKKQMAWFRKDSHFVFIPVDMECNKSTRVKEAAKQIADICRLSKKDYKALLDFDTNNYQEDATSTSDNKLLSVSSRMKQVNEQQGKGMKFFISKRERLIKGSVELSDTLVDADKCTKMIQK